MDDNFYVQNAKEKNRVAKNFCSLTWKQQLFLSVVLVLRALSRLGGTMGLQEGLPLSTVRQVLGVHAGQVHGQVQQHVRRQRADDACRVSQLWEIQDHLTEVPRGHF